MIDKKTHTVTVAELVDNGSDTINWSGLIYAIQLRASDANGSVTHTLAILDENSKTIYSKASLSDNATTLINMVAEGWTEGLPICGRLGRNWTVKITQSGAQGATAVSHAVDFIGQIC